MGERWKKGFQTPQNAANEFNQSTGKINRTRSRAFTSTDDYTYGTERVRGTPIRIIIYVKAVGTPSRIEVNNCHQTLSVYSVVKGNIEIKMI